MQLYDPTQDRWRTGPTLPRPLDHAAVTTDGHRVYVVGGQTDQDGTKVVLDAVWMLDENDQTWRALDPLPEPRAARAAAWDGARLVFAGGYAARSTGPASSDVWVLEGSGWTKLEGQLQRARQHLAAATDGRGQVWFLAGSDGADRFGLVDIVMGDSITPGPQVSPVGAPAAVWHPGGGVCLLGGIEPRPNQTPNAVTTNAVACQETEPGTHPWPPLPDARGGAGAAILGSDVYVVGGYGQGFKLTDGVQVLEFG